ncbi:hypothetical protein DFH09DRAFT_1289476 [Mycena vulgaris]|nr:hypothetical protein DFH09DRAFT_1289476 [Mycena vulgaris]
MPDRFGKWVRGFRPERRPSSRVPTSTPLQPEPPSASEPLSLDPKATSPANATIDNLTVVLGLVQQVANIIQKVAFIAPAAALMSELLKVYNEVKGTDEKREVLLANITELTRDLCGTILRMEATNHLDLIGRLKVNIEAYTVKIRCRLLGRASSFIKECDNQGVGKHVAARNELGSKMTALNREMHSFGARFRRCRSSIGYSLKGKLEEWLACPDMRQKQLEILELRHEGTGHWLLEGNEFIHCELVEDKRAAKDLANSHLPPAIALFYFDFKDKQGQAVDSALQRIINTTAVRPISKSLQDFGGAVQVEVQRTDLAKISIKELQKIFEALLLELGRTYIVLDALDEWRRARSAKSAISGEPATCGLCFSTSEVESNPAAPLAHQPAPPNFHRRNFGLIAQLTELFRMAACLIIEISHCSWEHELDKTLDNLPNDLFGIYDRFLQSIRPEHLPYAAKPLSGG